MPRRLIIFLFGFFVFLRMEQVVGQTNGRAPILYSLTEQNGLSDNVITCFFQDSRSNMWIGTQDGLNMFNGSAIKIFRHEKEGPFELTDNVINDINEDASGKIWIGTNNGLSMYDPAISRMQGWKLHQADISGDLNQIRSIAIDRAGKIFLGTAAGLSQFDPATSVSKTLSIVDNSIKKFRRSNNFINQVFFDRAGQCWIATFTGLWRFYPDDGHFQQILSKKELGQEDELVSQILQDHAGQLWISLWNGGIRLFDPGTKTTKSFPVFKSLHNNVAGMAEIRDHNGSFHLYFSPQLNEFDPSTASISAFLADHFQGNNNNTKLGKLYTSRDNLLWMASDDGVRIMDPAKQVFQHYFISDDPISNQGTVLMENPQGLFVGGADKDFLSLYDSSLKLKKRVLPGFAVRESGEMINPALLHITREDSSHIWLCTEKGIFYYDEVTRKINPFRIESGKDASPTANFINFMLVDSKGTHWIFPWRNGIWQVDPKTGECAQVFDGFLKEFNIQKKLLIADAVEDHLGNIWMADLDEGLIYFDRSKNAFSKPAEKWLGQKFVLQNIVFENPYIWIVTNGKILRINAGDKSWEQWLIPLAFNKAVTGFCSDHSGHLWITTVNGLLCFDKSTKQFKRFSTNDGLLDNNLHGSLLCLKNDKIIYAGENYLTEFDPLLLTRPTISTEPRITGLYSQNQSLDLRQSSNKEKRISLNYRNNDLTFYWALPNYSNPLQNQYFCKLDGVDKDWKYVGNKGESQYASLEPGSYLFHAKAAAGNGIMSGNEDRIMVIIAPPFWRQWWFIAGALILVFSIIYILYRLRIRQFVRLERLRSRISSDLHDDIGSTLSSISIISDLALQEMKSGQTALIKEIRENSTSLMEKMDDIVWSINPRNDSLENLMLRVKQFASRLFEAKNIEYTINIQDGLGKVRIPMEFRQHIYLIIKEAINNLVKYSNADHASLDVSCEKKLLHVLIKDNGKGFPLNEPTVGNGILNMKSRASLMHADLAIDSAPEKGTSIEFRVKIK
ncbi:MAG: two-component regulator propeller domain-containing protein [Chitinophagales bacterium]